MTETGYGLPEQGAKTNTMEFNGGKMTVFHFDLKKNQQLSYSNYRQ